MQLTIYFDRFGYLDNLIDVHIHAWNQDGWIYHHSGTKLTDDTYQFVIDVPTGADPKKIEFKYLFIKENNIEEWEDKNKEFEKKVPLNISGEIYTYPYTRRCTKTSSVAVPADNVKFHLKTREQYRNGWIFIWNGYGSAIFQQSNRDDSQETSEFNVSLEDWMKGGFLFKFVNKEGTFEPDSLNKVWRPSDGSDIWTKSGLYTLSSAPFQLIPVTIKLVHAKDETPSLIFEDFTKDFKDEVFDHATARFNTHFNISTYHIQVYDSLDYFVWTNMENWDYRRPLYVEDYTAPVSLTSILGINEWKDEPLKQDVNVSLIIHPNPHTEFDGNLKLQIGVGGLSPFRSIDAKLQNDRTWKAEFEIFPYCQHYVEILPESGLQEFRADMPQGFRFRRRIEINESVPSITIHTVVGIAGVCSKGTAEFEDVDPDTRKDLMAAAFSRKIVDANVFAEGEMPHGAVVMGGDVWFVLKAPHAVQAKVIIPKDPVPGNDRPVDSYEMHLTPDLNYWHCKVPTTIATEGTFYRFLLNDGQELIDAAVRDVHNPIVPIFYGELWARNNQKIDGGPWGKVLYKKSIDAYFAGSVWDTMGWEYLIIYEMHVQRLTLRYKDLDPFDRLLKELESGKYLYNLGVTAFELMPVHEFSGNDSWGYNPSCFFAVESSFGSSHKMAKFVRRCHDIGKGVILDVVYNHMTSSPLQAVSKDYYVDGDTTFGGEMVNYDCPAALEFFRQAIVYMWHSFQLDGFRFDCTEAIVNGQWPNDAIIKQTGSGGGWEFLDALHQALRRAATAEGKKFPYCVGENIPNRWELTDETSNHAVLDGEWDISYLGSLSDAAWNDENDKSGDIINSMNYPDHYYVAVRGTEHDWESEEREWKKRIVAREKWGNGFKMAKAVGCAELLVKGIPMFFMGDEYGEHLPFSLGNYAFEDPRRYLRLDDVEQDGDMQNILNWFNNMMGLRKNPNNFFGGDRWQKVGRGHKTIAFTSGYDKFFAIVTFGTLNTVQNLAWLGLPSDGIPYKESHNSTWNEYRVENESQYLNGGYDASLYAHDNINLPSIGAVILERH